MTRVKFVLFEDGDLIALFPDELYTPDLYGKNQIMSYMHIGQHGGACRSLMRKKSAKKHQYNELFNELKRQGYDDLVVMNKE